MNRFSPILMRLAMWLGLLCLFFLAIATAWREGPAATPDLTALDTKRFEDLENKPLWGFFYPAWNNPHLNKVAPLIDDPFHRTDASFEISAGLRPRVLFWMAVYGVFESKDKIVHDRDRPDLIYGHIALSDLAQHLSGVQLNQTSLRIEESVKIRLAKWMTSMAKGMPIDPAMVDETQRFKNFLIAKGFETPEQWMELTRNIRSQSGQKDAFVQALARSQSLLPEIEDSFRKHGLPKHAARIPFVESSFHPGAQSKVGAMGIWQFTPQTAKEWISTDRTKWKDPHEQTIAAARMLSNYRHNLPDWGTTVTAYNSGVTRLMKLVKQNHATRLEEILANDDSPNGLGFAGENFYSEVLAATLVEAYKTEIFTQDLLDGVLALKEANDLPLAGYCADETIDRSLGSSNTEEASAIRGDLIATWIAHRWNRLSERFIPFQKQSQIER